MDAKLNPGTPGSEGVLANFFNSLLNKKSGSPGTPTGVLNSSRTNGNDSLLSAEKLAVRSDAAAELNRLARSVNKDVDLSQSEC